MSRKTTMRIDVNWHRLERELLDNVDKAQKVTDLQVLKDCGPYIPRDEGELERSGPRATVIGSGEVVWDEPYAQRQYYKLPNKARDVHPLAVMRWFEAAKAARKSVWLRVIKKAAGR